jgi:hypothetical protein
MKHILEFKQYKLFDNIDSPRDIAMYFLNNYLTKENDISNKENIQTWEEGFRYLQTEIENSNILFEILNDSDNLYSDVSEIGTMDETETWDIVLEYLTYEGISDLEGLEPDMHLDEFFDWWQEKTNTRFDFKRFDKFIASDYDRFYTIFRYESDIDTFYNNLLLWVREKDENVFRMLALPSNIHELSQEIGKFKDFGGGVGIFWSYDEGTAEEYLGENYNQILLIAKIEPKNINWKNTLKKSLYNLNYEQEIELVEGSSIKIVSIKIDNRDLAMLSQNKMKSNQEYYKSIGLNDFQIKQLEKGSEIIIEFKEPIIVKV